MVRCAFDIGILDIKIKIKTRLYGVYDVHLILKIKVKARLYGVRCAFDIDIDILDFEIK
jgi:hypothetical protein